MKNRNQAIVTLTLTMALVALVITYAKQSLEEVPFFTFVWLQMVFASIAMIINSVFIKKEKLLLDVPAKIYLMVLGIGLLNYLIVRLLFIYSLDLLPVTTHAYLMNFVGIVTMLLSSFLLKEKPRIKQLLGAALAILGLWIFFYDSPKEGEGAGIIAIAVAVICLALTNILIRGLQIRKIKNLTHNQIATSAICCGSIPLVIYGLLWDLPLAPISWENWLIIILNGVFANAFVMLIFSQAMVHLKAFEASILAMSALIFTALFAMPVLDDYLAVSEIIGIGFMLVGIGIVQWKRIKN